VSSLPAFFSDRKLYNKNIEQTKGTTENSCVPPLNSTPEETEHFLWYEELDLVK